MDRQELKTIDDVFRIHVLGVGNSFSEDYSTVSFVVQAGRKLILLEAPSEPIRKLKEYRIALKLQAAGLDLAESSLPGLDKNSIDSLTLDNINDVIVTHVHGDHSAGLEPFAWYKMFHQKNPVLLDYRTEVIHEERRPRLYGTADVIDDIKRALTPSFSYFSDNFNNFFSPIPINSEYPKYIAEGVKLEICETAHDLPCFAVKLTYKGRSFAYSSDTRFDTCLMRFLSTADVLIHECDDTKVVHTTSDDLKTWLRTANYNGRFYVCHFPDAGRIRQAGLTPLVENEFVDV